MNTENLCSMEEIHEKEKELKMKLDRGDISQEEYETENRKPSNQKRWLDICEKRNNVCNTINTYKKDDGMMN